MVDHFKQLVPAFRLNLSVTPPYNADFDGDEMNMQYVIAFQYGVLHRFRNFVVVFHRARRLELNSARSRGCLDRLSRLKRINRSWESCKIHSVVSASLRSEIVFLIGRRCRISCFGYLTGTAVSRRLRLSSQNRYGPASKF